jgi:3-polyprenyl-4-hydroxybenzoate decarboxylase
MAFSPIFGIVSGAIYGVRLLKALHDIDVPSHLNVSKR